METTNTEPNRDMKRDTKPQSQDIRKKEHAKVGKYEGKLYSKTILKELGNKFPVPILDSSGQPFAKQDFTFNEWDMVMEETLSKLKGKAKTTGLFVSQMMGTLFADFCGQDFTAVPEHEKTLRMNQLEFANMMYAYIYLRVEELGPDFVLDVGCPTCGKLNKDFCANLEDLDVHVKDHKKHSRTHIMELKRPITLDDKIITAIELSVGKWDSMEKADREVASNAAKMKRLLFESSITGIHDSKGPIEGYHDIQNVIKKLKKYDIEMCMRDTIENNAGPTMAISGECVHCGTEWWKELDWRYDSFFDSSSL